MLSKVTLKSNWLVQQHQPLPTHKEDVRKQLDRGCDQRTEQERETKRDAPGVDKKPLEPVGGRF